MAATSSAVAPKAGRNLPAAIGVAVLLIVPIAAGLIWFNWLFIVSVTVLLCVAVWEVSGALRRKDMHAETVPIILGTAVSIIGGYWVAGHPNSGLAPMTFIVACLAGTVLAAFGGRLLRGGADGFIRDIAASAFVIAYLPLLGVAVSLLMATEDGDWRILTLILATVLADTGAYATGMLLGRHKMAPSISPAKSWEGFIGGLMWAAISASLCGVWLLGITWWQGALLGIIVGAAGTVGDLLESAIKRDASLKDMSHVLPGHGGVMDRLDSLLLAFPVGWFVLTLTLGS